MAKKSNTFVKMAVNTAMFGVGAGLLNDSVNSFNGNPAAQNIVRATGTVYAAKMLKDVADESIGSGGKRKKKDDWGLL